MKNDTGFEKSWIDRQALTTPAGYKLVAKSGYVAATERALRAVEFVYKERGDIDDAESACREIRRLIEENENL